MLFMNLYNKKKKQKKKTKKFCYLKIVSLFKSIMLLALFPNTTTTMHPDVDNGRCVGATIKYTCVCVCYALSSF